MAAETGGDMPASDAVAVVRDAQDRRDVFYTARQWNHYFGAEYEADWLPYPLCNALGWIDEDEDEGPLDYRVLVAEADDVLVGAGIAVVYDHESAVAELPDGQFDAGALVGDRNGWLLFSAVDPEWRGYGIGRQLFRERVAWTDRVDTDMTFGYGWERRHGRTSRPLFEANGFVPIQRFEDYYGTDDSPRDCCPDCGAWPSNDATCRCDMTLWARDGDAGGSSR